MNTRFDFDADASHFSIDLRDAWLISLWLGMTGGHLLGSQAMRVDVRRMEGGRLVILILALRMVGIEK